MSVRAPVYLTERAYPAIEQRMVGIWPGAPGAAIAIPNTPDNPSHRSTACLFEADDYDISLARQLHQVRHSAHSLATPAEQPSAYLFTAYSAIPVRSAVSAFYQSAGEPMPLLDDVKVAVKEPLDSPDNSRELKRLTGRLAGLHTVCIVDQYIQHSTTIVTAAHLAYAAGAQQVIAIRGSWYQEGRSFYNDTHQPTSTDHEAFFTHLGEKAFRSYEAFNEHFDLRTASNASGDSTISSRV